MPKFTYKAGMEPATATQTTDGAALEMTKLPAEVTMFGIDFLKGQPTKVEPHMFREAGQYEHAVKKLRGNQHFEEAPEVEDAAFVDVKPAPKRGRPPAQPASPPPDEPTE